MDPIFEAYKDSINEGDFRYSKEMVAIKKVLRALQSYKKNKSALKELENAVEQTGDPKYRYKFPDKIQSSLEYLGDRLFGPPPIANAKFDTKMLKVMKQLEDVVTMKSDSRRNKGITCGACGTEDDVGECPECGEFVCTGCTNRKRGKCPSCGTRMF